MTAVLCFDTEIMSSTFDFTQCLASIESIGKKLYHPGFTVIADDYEIIYKQLIYFLRDSAPESITFPSGKEFYFPVRQVAVKPRLMNIIRMFQKPVERFLIKSCRDVSFELIQDGYSIIHKYSKLSFKNDTPRTWCFDDLGTENNLKYSGNDCNVMAEILLSRYDLFVSRSMLTHRC